MDSDRNQPFLNNGEQNFYPSLQQNPTVENNYFNQGYPQQQQQPQRVNQGWNNQQQNQQGWNNQNQGWNNQNQGWNNNNRAPQNQGYNNVVPPNYGGQRPMMPVQQPMMPGQLPMPNIHQDKIIIIREQSSIPCRMCGFDGPATWRQSAGCATISWCVCLFIFTGLLGFWIPFCIDGCYDTQVICTRCGNIKTSIPADCC